MLVRIYLKIILSFIAVFLALNAAASTVGGRQPPNPALEGFTVGCEGKPQPCWYGIVPGITTAREAKSLLTEQGFVSSQTAYPDIVLNTDILRNPTSESGCEVSIGGNIGVLRWTQAEVPVTLLTVDCPTLKLGDVMYQLGAPDFIEFCGFSVVYRYGITIGNHSFQLIPSPHTRIELSLWDSRYIDEGLAKWRGFAPCWRYLRL